MRARWGMLREPCVWATSCYEATRVLKTCRQIIGTRMLWRTVAAGAVGGAPACCKIFLPPAAAPEAPLPAAVFALTCRASAA